MLKSSQKNILPVYIRSSNLLLFVFAAAFLPRIFDNLGAPSTINFAHFALLPFAFAVTIITTKVKNRTQIINTQLILVGLAILLAVMVASALLNNAGIINVFVSFMLLAEPFLFLTAFICLPFSPERYQRFRAWLIGIMGFHLVLALIQKLLLTIGIMKVQSMTPADNVQGVFYLSGGGHVVGASVSLSFALYLLFSTKKLPLWMRIGIFLGAIFQLLAADAKQVLAVFMLAWVILIFTNFKNLQTTLKYIISAIVVTLFLAWCIYNLPMFRAFNTWIRPGYYGPDGIATQLKLYAFHAIHSYYESPWNWLLGLGPGHTVGRLGGWMLQKYDYLLLPLGATVHPVSAEVFDYWRSTWLDSSFFSPLFGWVAIWGDFGFLGLVAYLYLSSLVWTRLCFDDFSRFLLLTVMIHGCIFTQMEEPGYMLSVACLIGLRWQDYRFKENFSQI